MTNSEANANTPDYLPGDESVATPDDLDYAQPGAEWVEGPSFTEVEPTYAASREGALYRYLSWVSRHQKAYSINLDNFSFARQAGIAVLVDHGLVSERRWTGGANDGRRSFRVTPAGKIALAAARSAADEVLTS